MGLGRACAFRGSSEGPLLSVYGWFFEHLPGPYQDGIGREVSTVWTGYDLVLSRLYWEGPKDALALWNWGLGMRAPAKMGPPSVRIKPPRQKIVDGTTIYAAEAMVPPPPSIVADGTTHSASPRRVLFR